MNKTLKTVLIVGGTVIGLLVVIPLISRLVPEWGYGGWGMMGSGMMGGFAGMGLMSIVWIVILGLIIWAIIAVVGGMSRSEGQHHTTDWALNLLKNSYARGEISKEEYIEKRKSLS
jgi:putative membrane protein